MHLSKIAALIVTGAGLAACNTTAGSTIVPGEPIKLTAAQINAVHTGVRDSLKDPESARFGDLSAAIAYSSTGEGTTSVCGMVNAKNSYGGYGGSKPYMGVFAKSGRFMPVGIGGDEVQVTSLRELCTLHGIAI